MKRICFLIVLSMLVFLAVSVIAVAQLRDVEQPPVFRDEIVKIGDPFPGGGDDESDDGICDDDEIAGDQVLTCEVSKVTANLDLPVPTATFWGTFCENPTVVAGQVDGTFQPVMILSVGPGFITVDLTGNDDPAEVTFSIECPCETCEMAVTMGAVGPTGPPGPTGPLLTVSCPLGRFLVGFDAGVPICKTHAEILCGNGILDCGEQCDDGNTVPGDGCDGNCMSEVSCGNGILEPFEECDDGNNVDGDGCSALCEIEIQGGTEPTLASIQENIFTPICSVCHFPGGVGPMPLHNEAASYDSLVNAGFSFTCTVPRVDPGNPDGSCLVLKIEGSGLVSGNRMPPPPLAPLSQEEIDAIRQWITDGALP
jgi:cysteine-rich repeat protein